MESGLKESWNTEEGRAQRSRRHVVPICEEQAEGWAGYGQEHQGLAGETAEPGWADSQGERAPLQDEA